MRALLVSTVALAMSLSGAAFAQSQQGSGKQGSNQQAQPDSTRSYKEVESALKQAGIQEVRTLNAAYLVSAVTKSGEQVTFVVDPPSSSGSSASNSGGQQGGSQQSGNQQSGSSGQQMALQSQQQVRDSLTKAGFSNVQILDATYLASGKTKNGDRITMMIDPTATTASSGSTSNSKGMSGQSGGQSKSGQSGSSSQ